MKLLSGETINNGILQKASLLTYPKRAAHDLRYFCYYSCQLLFLLWSQAVFPTKAPKDVPILHLIVSGFDSNLSCF